MENNEPENTVRTVVDACSDCDVCRFLMDSDCLMFPELYRLYDKERETGERITSKELRYLVDLCSFCALCPCPNIRGDIIKAKTQFIQRDGLKFGVRTLEDVERVSRLCGAYPEMANRLFRSKPGGRFLKAAAGIHPARRIPAFPPENFPQWAQKHHLNAVPDKQAHRKIAYFAGCTANYFFPDVARAVVQVFQHHGFEVIYPQQKCCGMPSLLEGDQRLTMKFVRFNLERLSEFIDNGYDIVCSCPTCGFMLRNILSAGAYYSRKFQESVGADEKYLKIPVSKTHANPGGHKFELLQRNMYQNILKKDFHDASLQLGNRLMAKIKELQPEKLVTDCLSCRLQFNQQLPYKVLHPIEILKEAYGLD